MPFEVQLLLGVVFGVAGWQYARKLERDHGAPAWGMPSWVWGVITGLSLLLGVILLAFAERAMKRQPVPMPGQVAAQVAIPAHVAASPSMPVPAPVPVPAAPAVPAGWQPDPSGKYQHRWWDGQRWTSSVSTNGIAGTDA